MAIKNGFNSNARGILVTGSDRNLIVRLVASAKSGQRIRGIHYSYGIDSGSPAVRFSEGRIMIIKGAFEDEAALLYPDVPSNKSGFDVYFDQNVTIASGRISFGESGLYIPENTDASVVLTSPTTVGDVQPVFGSMIGSLMVYGVADGLPDPFKNLR